MGTDHDCLSGAFARALLQHLDQMRFRLTFQALNSAGRWVREEHTFEAPNRETAVERGPQLAEEQRVELGYQGVRFVYVHPLPRG